MKQRCKIYINRKISLKILTSTFPNWITLTLKSSMMFPLTSTHILNTPNGLIIVLLNQKLCDPMILWRSTELETPIFNKSVDSIHRAMRLQALSMLLPAAPKLLQTDSSQVLMCRAQRQQIEKGVRLIVLKINILWTVQYFGQGLIILLWRALFLRVFSIF